MTTAIRRLVEAYLFYPLGIEESDNKATTVIVSADQNLPENERVKREEEVEKKLNPEAWGGESGRCDVFITD